MKGRPQQDSDQDAPPAPIATRADPPQPKRLSRKMVVALSASASSLIAAAIIFSFSSETRTNTSPERVQIDGREADILALGPHDYGEAAKRAAGGIGPPTSAGAEPLSPAQSPEEDSSVETPRTDREQERRRNQAESARSSSLFASAGERRSPTPSKLGVPDVQQPTTAGQEAPLAAPSQRASLPNSTPGTTINSGRLVSPPGSHVLTAGSTIAAALITGLSSDLPGEVVAQVTEDVFDTATGATRLIPQGSRLIGNYDARVSYGQRRALVVWTRLILPDGRSLDLDRQIGTDAAGRSGFADQVDNHWGTMLKAGLLSTLLGIGSAAGELDENGQIINAVRDSAGQTIGRAGDRIVEKQLGVQPTIRIRPGARVRLLVSRDLILEPWSR